MSIRKIIRPEPEIWCMAEKKPDPNLIQSRDIYKDVKDFQREKQRHDRVSNLYNSLIFFRKEKWKQIRRHIVVKNNWNKKLLQTFLINDIDAIHVNNIQITSIKEEAGWERDEIYYTIRFKIELNAYYIIDIFSMTGTLALHRKGNNVSVIRKQISTNLKEFKKESTLGQEMQKTYPDFIKRLHPLIINNIIKKAFRAADSYCYNTLKKSIRQNGIKEMFPGDRPQRRSYSLNPQIGLRAEEKKKKEEESLRKKGIYPSRIRYTNALAYMDTTLGNGPYQSVAESRANFAQNHAYFLKKNIKKNIVDLGGGDGRNSMMILYFIQEEEKEETSGKKRKRDLLIIDDGREQNLISQVARNVWKKHLGATYKGQHKAECQDMTQYDNNEEASYLLCGCTPNRNDQTIKEIVTQRMKKLKKNQNFMYDFFIYYQKGDEKIVGEEKIRESQDFMEKKVKERKDKKREEKKFNTRNERERTIEIMEDFIENLIKNKTGKKKTKREKKEGKINRKYFKELQNIFFETQYNNSKVKKIYTGSEEKKQGHKEINFSSKFTQTKQANIFDLLAGEHVNIMEITTQGKNGKEKKLKNYSRKFTLEKILEFSPQNISGTSEFEQKLIITNNIATRFTYKKT